MSYQVIWFRKSVNQLRLLDSSVSFETVRSVVTEHLPLALKDMESKGLDMEDTDYWWKSLFINAVIKIENVHGKLFKVAVYLVNDKIVAEKALETVESRKFRIIRTDLGIDQHWIILTDANKPYSDDKWIDVLYEQIDQNSGRSGCALIQLS